MNLLKKIIFIEIVLLLFLSILTAGCFFVPMIYNTIEHQIQLARNPFLRLREKEGLPVKPWRKGSTATLLYSAPSPSWKIEEDKEDESD